MNEARGGSTFLGRDHHPALLHDLAGRRAASRRAYRLGATDELGYFITEGKMTVHDLQATDPAPARPRCLEADVSLPGIAAAADRPGR